MFSKCLPNGLGEDTLLVFPKVCTVGRESLGPRAIGCAVTRCRFIPIKLDWVEVSGGLGAPAAFSQGGYRRHPLRRELDWISGSHLG
jgi:hypothetical protein